MNAKEELIEKLIEIKCLEADPICEVVAAEIKHEHYSMEEHEKTSVLLKIDANKDSFLERLSALDYHDGYGSQELYGTVWLLDGSWLERRQYDGSEWWHHCTCPQIPDYLKDEE